MSRNDEFENRIPQPQVDLPRGVRAHHVYSSRQKPFLVYGIGETQDEARVKAAENLALVSNLLPIDGVQTRELLEGESYDLVGDGKKFLSHGINDGFSHKH